MCGVGGGGRGRNDCCGAELASTGCFTLPLPTFHSHHHQQSVLPTTALSKCRGTVIYRLDRAGISRISSPRIQHPLGIAVRSA